MLPLGCLSLWGREGGHPPDTRKRISKQRGEKRFPMKIGLFRYNGRMFIFYHCDERRRPKTGLLCAAV